MKYCPKCNKNYEDDDKYCAICGEELIVCPRDKKEDEVTNVKKIKREVPFVNKNKDWFHIFNGIFSLLYAIFSIGLVFAPWASQIILNNAIGIKDGGTLLSFITFLRNVNSFGMTEIFIVTYLVILSLILLNSFILLITSITSFVDPKKEKYQNISLIISMSLVTLMFGFLGARNVSGSTLNFFNILYLFVLATNLAIKKEGSNKVKTFNGIYLYSLVIATTSLVSMSIYFNEQDVYGFGSGILYYIAYLDPDRCMALLPTFITIFFTGVLSLIFMILKKDKISSTLSYVCAISSLVIVITGATLLNPINLNAFVWILIIYLIAGSFSLLTTLEESKKN